MTEAECTHEKAKIWSWGDLPRHIAQGWNWCEDCGALVKLEKQTEVVVVDVIWPKAVSR